MTTANSIKKKYRSCLRSLANNRGHQRFLLKNKNGGTSLEQTAIDDQLMVLNKELLALKATLKKQEKAIQAWWKQ